MFETLVEKAWQLSMEYGRISPVVLVRKFKIKYDLALQVYNSVCKRQHLEARKLVKEIEM